MLSHNERIGSAVGKALAQIDMIDAIVDIPTHLSLWSFRYIYIVWVSFRC